MNAPNPAAPARFRGNTEQTLQILGQRKDTVTSFGPFRLDRANARITRDGQTLALTPKAFDLLCFLVDSAGALLTKQAIFSQVWPNLVVSDAALSVCIREIRRVLGDTTQNPRYIETVHKRGFRFICPLTSQCEHRNTSTLGDKPAVPVMVGREQPLEILRQCLNDSASGRRQLVFITGEAGIGKTTLVDRFCRQTIANPETWVATGQCIQHYGTGEAYLPLLDAVDDLAQTHAGELAEILLNHAPSWLQQLPALHQHKKPSERHQATSASGSERMLREIVGALEAIAAQRQLVLILEDIHWSDHATLDLISFLARRTRSARLLLVGTYRPADAMVHHHPVKVLNHDLQCRGRCTTMPLELLGLEAIRSYLSRVFPAHRFPEHFPGEIYQQSAGNPLFMVNLLRYLKDHEFIVTKNGHWLLRPQFSTLQGCIPGDLEMMINEQISQLSPTCQTILEAASIACEPGGIAIQFTLTDVATAIAMDEIAVEQCLEKLVRNCHFLRFLDDTEWPNGTFSSGYEFTHALYQNILYRRVGNKRKMRLHLRFAECLEQSHAARHNEIVNTLAVHFELGGDYFRAAHYFHIVAQTAARHGANRDAIHTLEHALQLLCRLPLSSEPQRLKLALLLQLGPALTAAQGNASPAVEKVYIQAGELCERLGEQPEQFRVLFGLRSLYIIRGDLTKAQRLAQTLLELANELDASDYLLEAHVGLASSAFFAGQHQASHAHALQGITLYQPHSHAGHAALYGLDPGVFCLARAGQTAWPLGYPDQALDYEKQAVALAETLDHPYSLVFAIHNCTQVLLYRKDGAAALASARRGEALALKHGFSFLSAWAFHLNAWACALLGNTEQAHVELTRARAADRPQAAAADSYLSLFMAETYCLLEEAGNAQACLNAPCKEYSYQVERLFLRAAIDIIQCPATSDAVFQERIETQLLTALHDSRQSKLRSYELRIALALAKFWMQQDRCQQAHDCLSAITAWFSEGFATPEWQEAKHLIDRLDALRDNPALKHSAAAEQIPAKQIYRKPAPAHCI